MRQVQRKENDGDRVCVVLLECESLNYWIELYAGNMGPTL